MKQILFSVTLCLLLAAGSTRAAEGMECALSVSQYDHIGGRQVLLFSDTVDFLKGQPAVGFLISFSMDLELSEVDSSGVSFVLHIVTLGRPVSNYSRRYTVAYGLPARLNGIAGKGDAAYSLEMIPLKPIDIDTAGCGYVHTDPDDFKVDPSAHLNIHFVPRTLGDFHWNSVKGMMETEYRRFKELNRFTLPGKYDLYICPCRIYSVIWDQRFGMMVDPTRDNMFSVFTQNVNSTHPFLILHASILKHYGYAPVFLSEGFAGYLSDAVWAMKNLRAEGKVLPLDSLLDTYAFFSADPDMADKIAATFVRYLIEQYQIDTFLELYRRADDLSLRNSLELIYDKSVDILEQEWLHFVDTVTIKSRQLRYHADMAEAMLDYDLMREQNESQLSLSETRIDSTDALSRLVRTMFFAGNYYAASSYVEKLLEYDSTMASLWMRLGAYRMMNGRYEEGLECLQKAKSLDSTSAVVDFNIAMHDVFTNDEEAAIETLSAIISSTSQDRPEAESRVVLANLLSKSEKETDRSLAFEHYRQALQILARSASTGNPSPQNQMWSGIAQMGLGDLGVAYDYLQTAAFLETRPFYQGFINLWMGKLADMRGERDVAQYYYGQVLSAASADYHQREARKFLETPYSP